MALPAALPLELNALVAAPEGWQWMLAGTAFLAVLVPLLIMLRRTADTARIAAELRTVAAAIQVQQATVDVLERRLGQLQGLVAEDATRLRERVVERIDDSKETMTAQLGEERSRLIQSLADLREVVKTSISHADTATERRHGEGLKRADDSLRLGFEKLHNLLNTSLLRNSSELGQRVDSLTRTIDERLGDIAGQVDRRLAEGFEKTTSTFADVLKRLALIDEAQKRITALSGEVVSLQHVLADKRSRGAFGEVQLAALVSNVLPQASYRLQHTLPNGRIADCVIFLPEPSGTIAVDSKFPLESFRVLSDYDVSQHDRRQAERQFKQDIRKHIRDIAARYIISGVTGDGAIMFIPAEAVF
ncbi:MAG: DNA recombination protein RmuC, partial [Gammaproteobacteria bacterium]